MKPSEAINDIESVILRWRQSGGESTQEFAREIYAAIVPQLAKDIEKEATKRARVVVHREMVDAGWREPDDLSTLTRTALIEVAVAEQTKKIIEFPSTQYTENNVGNLCESLKALEISKRIDREEKEQAE
jgi:hypothetical protein